MIYSGEIREDVPSSLIKEMHEKCTKIQNFVDKYHLDKTLTSNLFNDQFHTYKEFWKENKQSSLDKF